MGDLAQIFPFFLIVLIVLAGLVAAVVTGVRRTRQVKEFAEQRGWEFIGTDRSLPRTFPRVAPFGIGSDRRASDTLRYNVRGRHGYSFTYTYTTGSGEDETTHTHHVVSLDLPHPLPRLVLRPETTMSRMGKLIGMQDVQFESEDFNRAWIVQSEHLPGAHDILHPRMMEWLLQVQPRNIVIEDETMYVWSRGQQVLEIIEPWIRFMLDFEDLIPAFVWQKAQGEYPRPSRERGFFT